METRLPSGENRTLMLLAMALCIFLSFISRDVSAGQGPLDGKTFVVETGEKGKSGGDKDHSLSRRATFVLRDVISTDLDTASIRRP